MTEETEETRVISAAALVMVNLLGSMGLNQIQAVAALEMAARIGRLELSVRDIVRADGLATDILTRAGLVQ